MAQIVARKFSVHIAYPDATLENMWKQAGFKVVRNFNDDFDILCFGGGADINPYLYGERRHSSTFCSPERDLVEIKKYRLVPLNMPKIGVCRGGQLLNVLCGGSMYQNVDGHTQNHDVRDTYTEKLIPCTSTHHQMMIPNDDAWILGVANQSTKRETFDTVSAGDPDWTDTEVAYYGHQNALCFQPHPEYFNGECREWFLNLVDMLLLSDYKGKKDVEEKLKAA